MKKCIFFSNHEDINNIIKKFKKDLLKNYDFIMVDIGAIGVMEDLNIKREKIISMVSYYLGSRTKNIKEKEIYYLMEKKIENILYFFDLSNLKMRESKYLLEELKNIKTCLGNSNFNIFIPLSKLSDNEISIIFDILKKIDCKNITIGNISAEKDYSIINELKRIKNRIEEIDVDLIVGSFELYKTNSIFSENKNLNKVIFRF